MSGDATRSAFPVGHGDYRGAEVCAGYAAGRRDFRDTDLHNADLRDSDLSGADFRGANSRSVDFRRAKLVRACFLGADLACSVFRGASLRGARFGGADLSDADFHGADLTDVDLAEARCTGVTWPEGHSYAAVTATAPGHPSEHLSALRYPDGETRYWCDGFAGTHAELVEYIADAQPELVASRERVLAMLDGLLADAGGAS